MRSNELNRVSRPWILALAVACAPVSPAARAQGVPNVSVTINVAGGACTIGADPDPVALSKQPDKPNHTSTWTWMGDQHGYTTLYFVLEVNDSGLGLCLPSVSLPDMAGRSNLRGFVITTQGTDAGAVSPLPSCIANAPNEAYKYLLIATKPSGDPCVQDPRVKIEG